MPRISEGSKQQNKEQLLMLLQRHQGLREAEIAEMLYLERRTVNNYLHELERQGRVYKEGRSWFTEEQGDLEKVGVPNFPTSIYNRSRS